MENYLILTHTHIYENPVRSLNILGTLNDYLEREYILGETPIMEAPHPFNVRVMI